MPLQPVRGGPGGLPVVVAQSPNKTICIPARALTPGSLKDLAYDALCTCFLAADAPHEDKAAVKVDKTAADATPAITASEPAAVIEKPDGSVVEPKKEEKKELERGRDRSRERERSRDRSRWAASVCLHLALSG